MICVLDIGVLLLIMSKPKKFLQPNSPDLTFTALRWRWLVGQSLCSNVRGRGHDVQLLRATRCHQRLADTY